MPELTATERLRALLDERGVEWTEPTDEYWELLGGMPTRNYVTIIGEKCVEEALDGTLVVYRLTPAQAIDATLGRGTCHDVGDPSDFCCSECGVRMFTEANDTYTMIASDERTIIKRPRYCPNCGRRVVE